MFMMFLIAEEAENTDLSYHHLITLSEMSHYLHMQLKVTNIFTHNTDSCFYVFMVTRLIL